MTGIYRYQSGLPYSPLLVGPGGTRIDPEDGRNGSEKTFSAREVW